ncbi:MAG: LodA/GoxA family CTQ-dependent oxidase [Alphaproteobacteria bacterium]|jgi:hypothetical protein
MSHIQFRVHPAIGIARMGDSETAFHISREYPTFLQEKFPKLRPNPRPRTHPWDFTANAARAVTAPGFKQVDASLADPNRFKDKAGRIMPQAARFRVFAYVYQSSDTNEPPLRVIEVTADVARIEWRVRLGNVKSITTAGGRKNAFNLAAAPQSLATSGAAAAPVQVKNGTRPALGTLFLEQRAGDNTKATGRLLVIGNRGESEGSSVPGTLWTDDWFDSAADGPVDAVITPDLAKLRTAAGLGAAEPVHYLDHGVAAPKAAAANLALNALPGWCVVGLPDYSPDMGHFVSVHDIALEGAFAALEAADASLKAKAEPGQHARIDDKAKTADYQRWDYDIHILPQLCLFGDVNAVSSYAAASPGHNKPPAANGMKIEPRKPADDALLRNPKEMNGKDLTKPVREWLKPAILGRLRRPGTLYRQQRFFIRKRLPIEYDTQLVFPRRLGRRVMHRNGSRYPDDGAPFGAPQDTELPFPQEVLQPPNLKSFNTKIDRKTRLCGAEKSFNQVGGAAATEEMRLLDDLYWPATPADMPLLRELAYTNLQYDHFTDWAQASPTKEVPFYDTMLSPSLKAFLAADHDEDAWFAEIVAKAEAYAPALLDMAHMGAMLGGSFLPGIEVGREAGVPQNWALYYGGSTRFPDVRFHPCNGTTPHPPGMLTKDLAIPWQKDYAACTETYWPTSRPGKVVRETAQGTFTGGQEWIIKDLPSLPGESSNQNRLRYYRTYWTMLGFIRREANDRFVERERAPGV